MTCPFCGDALVSGPERDLGEGETGGRATSTEHRCAACGVRLRRSRVDKIGDANESWFLVREYPPRRSPIETTPGLAPCASCGGPMISVMPANHSPPPPRTIASLDRPPRLGVMADARCARCSAVEHRRIV